MRPTDVQVLLLSGIMDVGTDRVCDQLSQRSISFLRLNFEQLHDIGLTIDPIAATLHCRFDGRLWHVGKNLRSVLWRLGTFPRYTLPLSPEVQLQKSQWAGMMRGLMLFDTALWMNNPAATYRAESKPYQLRQAAKLGFNVPATLMTNDPASPIPAKIGTRIALKSVDTVLLEENDCQYFAYTSLIDWKECADAHLHIAPVTCQTILASKLDLRVTVIGEHLWCDSVTNQSVGIIGDWRLKTKEELQYKDYDLPDSVKELCFKLMHNLGLRFGAIDLVLCDDRYWFIEINPTGEWVWLDRDDRGLATAIAEELACPHSL